MRVDELDYELPDELIAQWPPEERDGGRLLVLSPGSVHHRTVRELPGVVPPALWVVNDTRVLPARLRGHKRTGGQVEILLTERRSGEAGAAEQRWLALGRSSKALRPGMELALGEGLGARVELRHAGGLLEVTLHAPGGVDAALHRYGEVPLPPYIRRAPSPADREAYQTVYAASDGAVAAPTAGLHLSRAVLRALEEAGHRVARVTLHVGPGTFAPVRTDDLAAHSMHAERYVVPAEAAEAISRARAEGRPVLAVGTTVVRTLESAATQAGGIEPGEGTTSLFVRPGYRFQVVDMLLTNFHLPRSTLLALVMAFGGVDAVRRAYAEAVQERYRFFSYGDAMLLPARAP